VGRAACTLLYIMATNCMQQDSKYLVEADLLSLCALDLPQLFFELRQRLHAQIGSPDDAHIDWLFVRLHQTPLHRAPSGNRPAANEATHDAPDAQRGRAAGGSA